jgi:arylsulfatase A-like enzyme
MEHGYFKKEPETMKKNTLLFVTSSLLLACSVNQHKIDKSKVEKPNIIFILVDDLGYGDIGSFGQEKILTPNMDLLVKEGMKFTQAYAGNAVCAPSRSCLMQGKHPGHARVRSNGYENYRETLREGDFTVAMLLRKAGYKTGQFGKWGLACHDQYGVPNKMGFDEFYGFLNQQHAHCQYPEFLYHNQERVYFPENGTHHLIENYKGKQTYDENGRCHPLGIEDPSKAKYAFDVYCEKSLEFVRANNENPFFLYLSYTPPHGSYVVPELGMYNNKDWPLSHKVYAAMVTRVDAEIGKLLQLLKELNMDENTLIIFASDNGNPGNNAKDGEIPTVTFFNNAAPTRGMKGDIYDGAFRVPAIARWTNHIQAGQVSDQVWAFWDFLPTVAELVGVQAPEDIDGISILPTLLGKTEDQKKHDFLYWEYQGEQAVRMADWYGYKNMKGQLELYDLIKNPKMDNELSAQYPEIAKKINEIMKTEHTSSDAFPSPGETKEAFKMRMAQLGITEKDRPKNISEY